MKIIIAPRILYDLCIIFFLAFCVRTLLAYLFYGSIDVSAFIGINRHTLQGTLVTHPFSIWCAFPIIPFYLWFGGLLAIVTPLPIAFCFKLIPIVFDSLLACLLYDIMRYHRYTNFFAMALLYAFSPVALLVVCIHGQWDSLPIFFLLLGFYARQCCKEHPLNHSIFGALFAFSMLLKPIALVLAPFFFVPFKGIKAELGKLWYGGIAAIFFIVFFVCTAFFLAKQRPDFWLKSIGCFGSYLREHILVFGSLVFLLGLVLVYIIPWKTFSTEFRLHLLNQCASIVGFVLMVGICCGALIGYGFDIISVFDKVLRYFNQGITVFGLPFAYPFNQTPWIVILKNRFWIMGLISVVAYVYYSNRIALFEALGICFALIFSFSGLCPQYLLWLVPLLMITGQSGFFVLYNLLVSIYMLLYYAHPLGNLVVPFQNMLSFAALHQWAWIMPIPCFTRDWLAPIIHCLGNYILPLICMVIVGVAVGRIIRQRPVQETLKQQADGLYVYLGFPIVLTIGITSCMLYCTRLSLAQRFDGVVTHNWGYYDYIIQSGVRVANYQHGSWCNIIVVFIILIVLWSFAGLRLVLQRGRGML